MPQIHTLLTTHHKYCDELFSTAEEAAHRGDWPACNAACERFSRETLAHFDGEENLLFPAFENATGMSMGPTQVMRQEHVQVRELLQQMNIAAADRDVVAFSGVAETLLILMQQHNMKEENILYPMCDNALGASDLGDNLAQRLKAS